MHKLAELCVRRPVLAAVLVLIPVIFGIFGYFELGVDRFPKVDLPYVAVITTLPGAAPEEVETEITDKIEEAVNTVSGIDELRSVSSEGSSQVIVTFKLGRDVNVAAQEVRDNVNAIQDELPQDIRKPLILKLDPDAFPVLTLALSGPFPIRELSEYADKVLRRKLETVAGVGQVSLVGGQRRQINILVDPLKLRSFGLTVPQVAYALKTKNVQIPGGTLKQGSREFTVRTMGRAKSMKELGRISIANIRGHDIRISDVATVQDGAEQAKSLAQLNDTPTVLLNIRKQSGTNTIEIVHALRQRLAKVFKTLPKGYSVSIVRDQSAYIQKSINEVKQHLVVGSLLAAVVVLIFLANFRTTLISALSIPTSIISAFAVIYFMGYTLNMLTLLALTLSVGIVIDDAIVVLENIYRYIEEKGYEPREAALAATKEIGLAVLTITLSLVAIFLPIAFMKGIVGQFMKSFGVTMASAILLSMFVSFSLAPMLASRWLKKTPSTNGNGPAPDAAEPSSETIAAEHARAVSKNRGAYHAIERVYLVLLRFSLRRRWVVVAIALLLLASVPLQYKYVAKDFVPDDDQSEFQMQVRAPEGDSLEATQLIAANIARNIRRLNGVTYTITSTADTEQHVPNLANIYVHMTDINERAFSQIQLIDYVRKNIVPRYRADHLRISIKPIDPIAGNATDPGIYVVSGPDMKKLQEYANKLVERLKKVPGAVDVDSSLITGKPQYTVTINRDKADELGVSVTDIATTIRLLLAGEKVSDYDEAGEQYEVHLRAAPNVRHNLGLMEMVTLPSIFGKPVPLRDVVRFTKTTGPAQIYRLNRAREVTIRANMAANASLQDLIDALNDEAASLKMGPAYNTTLVGKSKEMARSLDAFLAVFLMGFVIAYLVIAAQFESWLHPITVLLALPLTLPFALFSLFIFHQSLNVFSILGMLVLFAVVKKNAILQIDHTIRLRAAGMSRYDAMIAANTDRLRPILMTTIAFVAGMIPLLLSSGAGAAINRPISSVVIGGQTLSLLLTLIATPVAYSLFDDLSNLLHRSKEPVARAAAVSSEGVGILAPHLEQDLPAPK